MRIGAHLPIGSAQQCSEALAAYADAGAHEVLLWPIRDALRQLERGLAAASSAGSPRRPPDGSRRRSRR